jgi:trehalose 6-phosphate synthase
MRRFFRFSVILVLGLGGATWLAELVVTRTTRAWFEHDTTLRAHAIVATARQALLAHLEQADRSATASLLSDMTRDERIMAAAACDTSGTRIAATVAFPPEVSCAAITRRLADPAAAANGWSSVMALPGGAVHVSAVPLGATALQAGSVVLVHDMSFMDRRERATRQMFLAAYLFLVVAGVVLALVTDRLSWRAWMKGFRRELHGEERRPEFRPLMRDVRELAARLAREMEDDHDNGGWSPDRLRSLLRDELHDARIVTLANRQPYIHERDPDGSIRVVHPASGLVTALEPIMRACSGVWVAHGSGSADREMSDQHARLRVPPGEESYRLRRVWLSPQEEAGYYYGFSNEGLWPLCHIAHTRPVFRATDWAQYQEVNRRFADAVYEEVDSEDPIILIQDYHFALAPRFIRERLPRAIIITFWHIPWPNAERVGICPFRNALIEGLLHSSILGFHTQLHCNQFFDTVDAYVESRIDREENAVIRHDRRTLVRPYPISTEWPIRWLEEVPDAATCRREIFAELALAPDALLGVGIDRLDYTKGVEERLMSVERLLERFPELVGRFTFAQLAAPSRVQLAPYRALNDAVERTAHRINARFGSGSYRPIALLRKHHEPPTVFRYYRAADLCYVSSLHDGMNLVAKEFIAAREDERGVLLLSEFTGAARELTEALIVNPYDLEQASTALAVALQMSPGEQAARMHAMRTLLKDFNVYRWAGRMLSDASKLRRKEHLSGRLSWVRTELEAMSH